MANYLTVVYTINDEKAFQETLRKLLWNFDAAGLGNGKPFAITAMSDDDEIKRIELIQEAFVPGEPLSLITKIIEHPCIGDIDSIDELE